MLDSSSQKVVDCVPHKCYKFPAQMETLTKSVCFLHLLNIQEGKLKPEAIIHVINRLTEAILVTFASVL